MSSKEKRSFRTLWKLNSAFDRRRALIDERLMLPLDQTTMTMALSLTQDSGMWPSSQPSPVVSQKA